MKILFIQPPGSYVEMPTLAVPCLQSALKKAGYNDVHFWDANIDYLEFLLHEDTLASLEKKFHQGSLHFFDDIGEEVFRHKLQKVRQHVVEAQEVFKDAKKFYSPENFDWAMNVISTAVSLYNHEQKDLVYRYNSNGFYCQLNRQEHPFSTEEMLSLASSEDIFSFSKEFFESHLPEDVSSFDLVAFTCANPDQFLPALAIARHLRTIGFKGKIMAGGSFISSIRQSLENSPKVFEILDLVGLFEGEDTIVGVCDFIAKQKGLQEIPNLLYFDGQSIQRTALGKIDSLDQLETPDFSGFDLNRYWSPKPVLPAYTTRGCFYDICGFCNHHENYFGKFRTRSIDLVLKDLTHFKEQYDATHIFFVDELMIPRDQVELAKQIREKGLGTRWYAHTRVTHKLDRDRMKILAEGGLTILHVGMESANTDVLQLMDKGYDRQTVLEFLENRKGLGLFLHLNTIEGYPGETREQYLETLETAFKYACVGDFTHLYPFGLAFGAPIFTKGSSFITHHGLDQTNDLDRYISFEKTDEWLSGETNEGKITALKQVLGRLGHANAGLFPQEAIWASHLLYLSRYKDVQPELLEEPLDEFLGRLQEEGNFGFGAHDMLELILNEGSETIEVNKEKGHVKVLFDPHTFLWFQIDQATILDLQNTPRYGHLPQSLQKKVDSLLFSEQTSPSGEAIHVN